MRLISEWIFPAKCGTTCIMRVMVIHTRYDFNLHFVQCTSPKAVIISLCACAHVWCTTNRKLIQIMMHFAHSAAMTKGQNSRKKQRIRKRETQNIWSRNRTTIWVERIYIFLIFSLFLIICVHGSMQTFFFIRHETQQWLFEPRKKTYSSLPYHATEWSEKSHENKCVHRIRCALNKYFK